MRLIVAAVMDRRLFRRICHRFQNPLRIPYWSRYEIPSASQPLNSLKFKKTNIFHTRARARARRAGKRVLGPDGTAKNLSRGISRAVPHDSGNAATHSCRRTRLNSAKECAATSNRFLVPPPNGSETCPTWTSLSLLKGWNLTPER